MWVKIAEGIEVRCVDQGGKKRYRYESKMGDEINVISHESNSPTETSVQSQFHKFLKSILAGNVYPNELDARIISIKNHLESSIETEYKEDNSKESEQEIHKKYLDLYTNFEYFLKDYDMTPLELIIATSHCLGVGKPREIIKAFFGYFQTYCGEKGTNVIAIGSPASGKSFTLETALSMIPQERVIYGAKTVAYFFRKYNGMDLTGYIFFIGDLGGSDDDADTIKFRDKLKQLTTDGYAERGVVDKDSMEDEDQVVTGYPSLSYTTAREEMVNEQEKTRSVILTPNPLDNGKLIVFKYLMENQGAYYDDLKLLFSIRDSIKGLVYKFSPDDYDWFNPYMFCITEHLEDHDDFPRKIDEFNAILKLVTILNNPQKLQHHMYYDEEYNEKDTPVFISSKRDNINALNIFDSANLLPDETRFANGIIQEYELFDGITTEDVTYEDIVMAEMEYHQEDDGTYKIDKEISDKVFTLRTLGKDHRDKRWYRKSRNYVNERVQRLIDESILIFVGKESNTRHNIYALAEGMTSSVDSPLPNFNKSSNIDRATNLFKRVFPNQVTEYIEFLENDTDVDTTDLFEKIKPIIPNLPYLEGEFDGL